MSASLNDRILTLSDEFSVEAPKLINSSLAMPSPHVLYLPARYGD